MEDRYGRLTKRQLFEAAEGASPAERQALEVAVRDAVRLEDQFAEHLADFEREVERHCGHGSARTA